MPPKKRVATRSLVVEMEEELIGRIVKRAHVEGKSVHDWVNGWFHSCNEGEIER